ncbi:hypothetical protein LZ30DRAFT_688208 [Colletotrichum cereale]|nr:hypothetical protein LZ30DRAFT_688208 [Colletotrichum cereale]
MTASTGSVESSWWVAGLEVVPNDTTGILGAASCVVVTRTDSEEAVATKGNDHGAECQLGIEKVGSCVVEPTGPVVVVGRDVTELFPRRGAKLDGEDVEIVVESTLLELTDVEERTGLILQVELSGAFVGTEGRTLVVDGVGDRTEPLLRVKSVDTPVVTGVDRGVVIVVEDTGALDVYIMAISLSYGGMQGGNSGGVDKLTWRSRFAKVSPDSSSSETK